MLSAGQEIERPRVDWPNNSWDTDSRNGQKLQEGGRLSRMAATGPSHATSSSSHTLVAINATTTSGRRRRRRRRGTCLLAAWPKNGIFFLYLSESLSLSLSPSRWVRCQRAGGRSTSTMHLGTFHWGHRPQSVTQSVGRFGRLEGENGPNKLQSTFSVECSIASIEGLGRLK